MVYLMLPLLLAIGFSNAAAAQSTFEVEPIDVPAGVDAHEPFLSALPDGRLAMIWTELAGADFSVKLSMLDEDGWNAPRVVVMTEDLFVNWADFPSVSAFADGTLVAHWPRTSGSSAYDYDVNIAVSHDDGASWSEPLVPHRDGVSAQHGFVTLVPSGETVVAVWLDGRAYDGELVQEGAVSGSMQLRAAELSSVGTASPDVALDVMTCSCCQTDSATIGDGLIVAYRDRTIDEIRDISVVALRGGTWSEPRPVYRDGWEIAGCPVNGPAIAALEGAVAVAWFTGAGNLPAVKIAMSQDGGLNFSDAVRIDRGQPVGRVDMLMLDDGLALVSWVEWTDDGEVLIVCRAGEDGCIATQEVATNTTGSSMNFPRMAAVGPDVYLAWTHPLPEGRDTIRMIRLKM